MSKLNDALEEAKTRLLGVDTPTISLVGKVVVAYNEDDLLDVLKGLKAFPAVGIVYEGMRAKPEPGATGKMGLSCEIVMSFVLVEQGDAPFATQQKKTRSVDYLDLMRDQFMGQRSIVTGHLWNFMVESPAALTSNMVCWVQRWSLPVQLPPVKIANSLQG